MTLEEEQKKAQQQMQELKAKQQTLEGQIDQVDQAAQNLQKDGSSKTDQQTQPLQQDGSAKTGQETQQPQPSVPSKQDDAKAAQAADLSNTKSSLENQLNQANVDYLKAEEAQKAAGDKKSQADKAAASEEKTPPAQTISEDSGNRSEAKKPSELTAGQRNTSRPEQEPEPHVFPPGTLFYKYADSDRVKEGKFSEYWSPVEPVTMNDGTKTEGLQDLSGRFGGDPERFRDHQRFRSAVSYDWNTKMDQFVVIETTKELVGYVGKANNQPYHESAPNVTMMGSDYQVILPDMKEGDYKVVDKGKPIVGTVAEQKEQNETRAGQQAWLDPHDLSKEQVAAKNLKDSDDFKKMEFDQKAEKMNRLFQQQDKARDNDWDRWTAMAQNDLNKSDAAGHGSPQGNEQDRQQLLSDINTARGAEGQNVQEFRSGFVNGMCKEEATAQVDKKIAEHVGDYKKRIDDMGSKFMDGDAMAEKFKARLEEKKPQQIEQRSGELKQENFKSVDPPSRETPSVSAPAAEAPAMAGPTLTGPGGGGPGGR